MSDTNHGATVEVAFENAVERNERINKLIAGLAAENSKLERINSQLEKALNPFTWTQEMSLAWHKNIPDTKAAFDALRNAAVAPLARVAAE